MSAEHDAALPLMAPAEAAEQLGKSADWLTRRANRGVVAHHKLGSSTRFCQRCVEEIAAQTYKPAGQPKPRATAKRYQRRPRYPRAVS